LILMVLDHAPEGLLSGNLPDCSSRVSGHSMAGIESNLDCNQNSQSGEYRTVLTA
jgi:hypothetical protein